ncbi:MAG: hypothetical protein Q7S42_05155, partial [Candidatus Omnitrophota bacterium]|nr:hypothetical protein [Candidatus Omnitrophota bacterium]
EAFKATAIETSMPPLVSVASFAGVHSLNNLPEEVVKPVFNQAVADAVIRQPVKLLVFEGISGEAKVKVIFPGGTQIVPTFGPGVPLGAEKPVKEPEIKGREEKE